VDDVAPGGEPFEISYNVNQRTRPVLEQLRVSVTLPGTYSNDLAMGWGICGIALVLLGGLATVGAVATISAIVRVRDPHPAQTGAPSSRPPGR
jgi:hypothetical protein